MKKSIDSLWSMFFMLQLIKSLTFFGIKIPANALIYIEELRKFIDFEMLSPDFVLKVVYKEDISVSEFLFGKDSSEA